jgi:hypothetical protein
VEVVQGVWNDAHLTHASFKAPPSMVGIQMGNFFTLGNRVCIWKLNPAVLAPHKIPLISHTSSRKNLLGPVARRDGGKFVHRSLCESYDGTVMFQFHGLKQ